MHESTHTHTQQGLGLGPRLSDAVARLFFQQGYRYTSKTSHPRFSAYRDRAPEWRCTSKQSSVATPNWATPEMIKKFLETPQRKRTTSAYEWVGDAADVAVFAREADADVLARWKKSRDSADAVLKKTKKKGKADENGRAAATASGGGGPGANGKGQRGQRKGDRKRKTYIDDSEEEEEEEEEEEGPERAVCVEGLGKQGGVGEEGGEGAKKPVQTRKEKRNEEEPARAQVARAPEASPRKKRAGAPELSAGANTPKAAGTEAAQLNTVWGVRGLLVGEAKLHYQRAA